MGEAQKLYAKYIINDSPFQVNLPDLIIRDLETNLKDFFSRVASMGQPAPTLTLSQSTKSKSDIDPTPGSGDSPASPSRPLAPLGQVMSVREPPTLFDRAQENIFKLMNCDSFPRYQRSEEYKLLLEEVSKRETKVTILEEVGIIEKKDLPSPRNTSLPSPRSTSRSQNRKIGRAVQQECRDRSRMPSSA
eukprot:TRINITY_DN81439_c0_g1_i1.p1 TRINITY_DN81439_c0_g1~~TRINITY_DN81439_c0_g1_i1.p1  ORF type:complete len:199 (-),score=27.72 TRINITY_DN81439_c0_g1_i1:11-580(-)